MKDLIEFYNQTSSEFQEILDERTPDEIAHDNVVIKELKKGRNIMKALKLAAKQYPKETLQYNDETIVDIAAHYDYLLNHEDIKAKINRLKN